MKNTKKPTQTPGRKSQKLSVAKQTLKDLDPKKQVKGGTGTAENSICYCEGDGWG